MTLCAAIVCVCVIWYWVIIGVSVSTVSTVTDQIDSQIG